MAYNYEYPYVDPGMYNDDWLLKQMKDLSKKFDDLKAYVDGIDFQQLVNNKIDAMATDGSLSTLVYNNYPIGSFRQNAIFVYGSWALNSKSLLNYDFAHNIAQLLYLSSVVYLSDPNYVMISSGPNSFANVLENFYNENSGVVYSDVFFFPSVSDMLNPMSTIAPFAQALASLCRSHKSKAHIITPIKSNLAFEKTDSLIINNALSLESNAEVYCTPIPPLPIYSQNAMVAGDGTISDTALAEKLMRHIALGTPIYGTAVISGASEFNGFNYTKTHVRLRATFRDINGQSDLYFPYYGNRTSGAAYGPSNPAYYYTEGDGVLHVSGTNSLSSYCEIFLSW